MVTHFHTNPLKPYLRVLPSLHFHPHPHPISARQVSISRQLPSSAARGRRRRHWRPSRAGRGRQRAGLGRRGGGSCGSRRQAARSPAEPARPPLSEPVSTPNRRVAVAAEARSSSRAARPLGRPGELGAAGGRVRGRLCPGSWTPSGLPARWGSGYFQPFGEWSPHLPTNPVSNLLQNPSQVSALGKSQSLLDFSLTYYPLTLLRIKN